MPELWQPGWLQLGTSVWTNRPAVRSAVQEKPKVYPINSTSRLDAGMFVLVVSRYFPRKFSLNTGAYFRRISMMNYSKAQPILEPEFIQQNPYAMRTRLIIILIIGAFIFESCTRSMSPYEAANNPRGRKCAVIK